MYSKLSEGWCLNLNPWGFFQVLFVFFLFWNISLVQIQAGEGRQISLTQKEKAFVKSHPVILVSNEMDWPPFDFAVGKHPFGLSIDMMNILGARIGIEFKYVNQYTWEELVTLFHNRKIDVLQSVYYNKSREKFGRFTRAYYRDKTIFVVPADAGNISDIRDFNGKTIAVPKGWAYEPFLKNYYPEISLLMPMFRDWRHQ
ncbi:MAG: transporter substrate-binding domain-containing protein [Desulfobacteraceae bacterium]